MDIEISYAEWCRSALSFDPTIMGGAIMFRGTRLTVREVGCRALRGGAKELHEDYPYLTERDVEFAIRFVNEH